MNSKRLGAGLVALALGALGVAAAAPAAAGTTTARIAYVRAAHLSPDTPKVDVYLTSFSGGSTKLWLAGVGYGDVSPYRRLPSGQYTLSMRPHGAPASSSAALRWTVRLGSGDAYTAAAIGQHTDLHGIVFDDSLATPKPGTGFVRVVQAARAAGTVSVTAGSTSLTAGTAYGTATSYVPVRAGAVTVAGRSVTSANDLGRVQLTVASRSINTVVVLDKQGGGIVLRPLTDAAAARTAPNGAVPAGGGGTAARPAGDALPAGLPVLLVVIAAGVLVLSVRWRRAAR